MKYTTLTNGIKMPMFGLGTFKVETGNTAYQTVLTALQMGYRHIDTAQMYGNESDIGKAIIDSKIPRNEIFITTKQIDHHHGNKAKIMADIDESLKKLQVEYVDLLLIHWPNHEDIINHQVWSVLETAYKQGKAKAIGVSNFLRHHLEALFKKCDIKPMVNQVEMHPGLNQAPLKKYLDLHDIKMISYGPFMKGGIYEDPYVKPLTELALTYQITVAQLVIAWGLQRDILMIPKSANTTRLKENFDAQDIVLKAEDILKINKLSKAKRVYTDPDNNPFNE